jgi:hypothetical protein
MPRIEHKHLVQIVADDPEVHAFIERWHWDMLWPVTAKSLLDAALERFGFERLLDVSFWVQ